MFDWLKGIVGEETAPFVAYILIFVLLLIGFFIIRAMLRQMRGGTFVNGGRGRKQRLAVIDATPIDNRRRLVLVRRDNVEHLVLIGGMNDLVVERDIELQSVEKVVLASSKPSSAMQSSKAAATPKPTEPAPPAIPDPKPVEEVQPQPSPAMSAAKVERPTPPQSPTTPVAPPPATKDVAAAAAPIAAATITGLAETQQSPDLEPTVEEVVKPVKVDTPVSADPAVGRFSAYAENQGTESEVAVDVPRQVKPDHEAIDEFKPINAPQPTTEPPMVEPQVEDESVDLDDEMEQLLAENPTESPPPLAEPQVKNDDSDLEDEMEKLLNRLTEPSSQ